MAQLTAGEKKYSFFFTEASPLEDGSVIVHEMLGGDTMESTHFPTLAESENFINSKLSPEDEI